MFAAVHAADDRQSASSRSPPGSIRFNAMTGPHRRGATAFPCCCSSARFRARPRAWALVTVLAYGLQLVEMARQDQQARPRSARRARCPTTAARWRRRCRVSRRSGAHPAARPSHQRGSRHRRATARAHRRGWNMTDALDELAQLLTGASRPLLLAAAASGGDRRVPRGFARLPSASAVRSRPRPRPRACSPRIIRCRSACSASAATAPRAYLNAGTDVVGRRDQPRRHVDRRVRAPSASRARPRRHRRPTDRQQATRRPTRSSRRRRRCSAASPSASATVRRHARTSPGRLPSSVRSCASQKIGRIAMHDAVVDVQSLLPADTIYTVDSGEHFVAATHHLRIVHPDAFIAMTGLGSMGQSIGAAIVPSPDRVVRWPPSAAMVASR